jgi:hypothetical protein
MAALLPCPPSNFYRPLEASSFSHRSFYLIHKVQALAFGVVSVSDLAARRMHHMWNAQGFNATLVAFIAVQLDLFIGNFL